jgi:hypothetical protein
MKLVRVIEEFRKEDDCLVKEYLLNISSEKILATLDDLVLNDDDYTDEIYDCYFLSEDQLKKISPFLTEEINADFDTYIYQLSCYEDNK